MTRWRNLIALVTVVAAFVVALPAGAHDTSYPSRVTIRSDDMIVFTGRVISDLHACEVNRKVKLYTGSGVYTGFFDLTNSEGHYRVETGGTTSSSYYTRVTRKVIERDDHRHVCRPDQSRTIGLF